MENPRNTYYIHYCLPTRFFNCENASPTPAGSLVQTLPRRHCPPPPPGSDLTATKSSTALLALLGGFALRLLSLLRLLRILLGLLGFQLGVLLRLLGVQLGILLGLLGILLCTLLRLLRLSSAIVSLATNQ